MNTVRIPSSLTNGFIVIYLGNNTLEKWNIKEWKYIYIFSTLYIFEVSHNTKLKKNTEKKCVSMNTV